MAEIITKTTAELRIEATEAVRKLNNALLNDIHSEVSKAEEDAKKAVSLHNKAAMAEDMAKLRVRANPMLEAIEALTVATISLKRNENKETKTITYDIEPSTTYIDLLEFEQFCNGKTIAHDTAWKYKIEKFNYLLALRVAKELGVDTKTVEKRYHISPEAMGIDMGKTPTSNTQLLARLQEIVDAILYEDKDGKNVYKATSHDVAFLTKTLTKAGKGALNVAFAQVGTTRNLVLRIMNRIVTDGSYGMEYKTKKDADKEEAAQTAA